MSRLFEPFDLGNLRLDNRIVIAPMCQYSAVDGTAGDWHLIHLGSLGLSGAGLLIVEATAVSAEARITPGDLGLYSDANEAGLRARREGDPRTRADQARAADRARGTKGIEPRAVGWRPADPGR